MSPHTAPNVVTVTPTSSVDPATTMPSPTSANREVQAQTRTKASDSVESKNKDKLKTDDKVKDANNSTLQQDDNNSNDNNSNDNNSNDNKNPMADNTLPTDTPVVLQIGSQEKIKHTDSNLGKQIGDGLMKLVHELKPEKFSFRPHELDIRRNYELTHILKDKSVYFYFYFYF
ncbi:1A family penicillin-binding protein [Reticulomyxa filosa]|uniref:1A family penicillin-binding protein n=1 Tax=Reticulomyxa filosa TaxID=46433 RepID=X6N6P8_RETFI|nr:1A family penicillin-binding protein [Reticulomyxa filosa]|eukprot:ETO21404.1 1A family penicillin-binding protein [Reticulomyxa filosa]